MKVPILLYHRLYDNEQNDEKYEINVDDFEKHIKYLSENGFHPVSFSDIFDEGKLEKGNINKSVLITFDDGSLSDYSLAFPVLKKYNYNATFFITSNWIGTENFMTLSNLDEMLKNGMSIQSHGMSHSFLSDLDTDDLYKELSGSKRYLEEKLKVKVDIISIPGGFYSGKVLNAAKKCGYKCVCTSVPGIADLNCNGGIFQVFDRFVITRRTSFLSFKAIVNQDYYYTIRCKLLYSMKAIFKKILGSRVYYAIWSLFFRKA